MIGLHANDFNSYTLSKAYVLELVVITDINTH